VTSEKMAQGDFGQAISDYYLSNPIARASALMAELSANAKVRNSAPLAAE
jgi:NADH-quinone oxidoreductase subunit G